MYEYQLISQKLFESHKKFEQRVNDLAREGWRATSVTSNRSGQSIVLLEKQQGSRYS